MGKSSHFLGQPILGQLLNYLKYYIDVMGFLEHPEKDWEVALEEVTSSPPAAE